MAAKRGGGRIKTVVYLDVLLLTNFLTAYLLLLAAGALSGQRAPFARMLAGSALAALSALILFAPEQPYPVQVAYKAATALGITAAAFGWRSRRRLVPCGTAAEKSLLPGFAVQGIGLITENGVLGLGRSAVVFAPRSFGSTAYEALYGNDFM